MSASFFATIGSFVLCWLAYQVQLVNEYLISIYADSCYVGKYIVQEKLQTYSHIRNGSLNIYCKPASGNCAVYSSLSNL